MLSKGTATRWADAGFVRGRGEEVGGVLPIASGIIIIT